jgi:aspartyl/glutamyl-tRNA(Asn/Gln) amidotransferase C subunit
MPTTDENEPITVEIFDHLVRLAQIELNQDEAEYLRAELNGQMNAIRELESIELPSDVPITSHGVPYQAGIRPALREDTTQTSDLADRILEGAPEIKERYLVVPDIPHVELE